MNLCFKGDLSFLTNTLFFRLLVTQVEYCSTALSWIVEALSQSDLVKQTRPPPLPSKGVVFTLLCLSPSLQRQSVAYVSQVPS